MYVGGKTSVATALVVLLLALLAPVVASAGAPFVGVRALLWDTRNPGYCAYADGAGWDNALSWPTVGRTVKAGRAFRPGHEGIDILADTGEPVHAAATGVVTFAGASLYGGGTIVVLAHGNGWRTYYGHLSDVSVACGQWVGRGELIGASGESGTTFAHLHFGVHRWAGALDPELWLSGAIHEAEEQEDATYTGHPSTVGPLSTATPRRRRR